MFNIQFNRDILNYLSLISLFNDTVNILLRITWMETINVYYKLET